MKKWRIPSKDETGTLIAIAAVIFGGWTRLFPPLISGFPINDGGLFYVMVKALQENNLRLPSYVLYNGQSIPFAYPPLGFYVGAILSNALGLNPMEILRWLPAIILVLALAAFYGLSTTLLDSRFRAGVATLMYAFTPRAITWQVMGGGLTRSFGQLFLILALTNIYATFKQQKRKELCLSILFSSFVVLTHPEAAIHTICLAILFWIVAGRSRKGIMQASLIGAGTAVATAIWWIPLTLHLGFAALISAGQTGLHSVSALFYPLLLTFTDEPLMTLVTALAVIGFAFQVSRKEYLVPLMSIVPFLVEPRSAPTVATIPLAMLAGLALSELILPALARSGINNGNPEDLNPLSSRIVQIFMAFIGFYLLGSTFYFGTQIAGTTLTTAERRAFEWITENTPENSRFLILTGDTELFCDSTQEWFPALTNRVSLTTIQGKEWLGGRSFATQMRKYQAIQSCLGSIQPAICLNQSIRSLGSKFDYIYISRKAANKVYCRATGVTFRGENLAADLEQNENYQKVYETDEIALFTRNSPPQNPAKDPSVH